MSPMFFLQNALLLSLVCAAAVPLAACGGGGGGGSAPAGTSSSGTTWVSGQFSPPATFAAMCVTPRTGIDPVTQQPYPDHAGTALDEKNWLRSWTNDLYLWFSEVPDQDPAAFASDATYFDALKTSATTASGKLKDRFHFTYPTAAWTALSHSGVQGGYGVNFVIIAGTPPR